MGSRRRRCCVPGCRSNFDNTETFVSTFSFPKDETRRSEWLKCISRDNFIPGSHSVVCTKHFSPELVIREDRAIRDDGTELVVARKNPKLANGACPSIFPDRSHGPSTDVKSQREPAITFRHEYPCCAKNCKEKSTHDSPVSYTFHRFPRCEKRRNEWVNALNRENFRPNTNSRICSKHFERKFFSSQNFGTVRLKSDALPRIFDFPDPLLSKAKGKNSPSVNLQFNAHQFLLSDSSKSFLKTGTETESQNIDDVPVVIKKEPIELSDNMSPLVIENVLSVKELIPSTSSASFSGCLPLFISSYFPENALSVGNSTLSNREETSVAIKPERQRKIIVRSVTNDSINAAQAKLDQVHDKSAMSSKQSTMFQNITEPVIKQEPITSFDEPPPLVVDNVLAVKNSLHSTNSSSFTGNALIVGNADSTNTATTTVVVKNSDSIDVDKTPVLNKREGKRAPATTKSKRRRKLNNSIPDVEDSPPSAKQAKMHVPAKSQMSLETNRNPQQSFRTTESSEHSTSKTEDTQNVTREILFSLLNGSENIPLSGSRTSENSGDLFDAFARFIAEKLRKMDWDSCAFALKAILDIVFKADQVHQSSDEEESDISNSDTSSKSSFDSE